MTQCCCCCAYQGADNEIRIKITKEDLGEILHQKNYHVVTAAGDAELAWYNTPELFLEEDS